MLCIFCWYVAALPTLNLIFYWLSFHWWPTISFSNPFTKPKFGLNKPHIDAHATTTESDFSRFFILFHSIYNEHSKCRKIEPANNILIPLWKINFFYCRCRHTAFNSVGSLKKAKMKWIFSSSFIHRVHIVHSIFTQSNQQFCMQPEQWLMSYYSTHSQGLMKKANNIPRVNAAKKESSHVKMDRFFLLWVKTEQFSLPLHALLLNIAKKKWMHGEKFRRKKNEICVIDHRWCFFMVLCRNSVQKTSAIYSLENVIPCE